MLEETQAYFHAAADVIGLSDNAVQLANWVVTPPAFARMSGTTVTRCSERIFEAGDPGRHGRRHHERFRQELELYMQRAYRAVSATAKERKIDLRTAAFVVGMTRVGRAALARRPVRESIEF